MWMPVEQRTQRGKRSNDWLQGEVKMTQMNAGASHWMYAYIVIRRNPIALKMYATHSLGIAIEISEFSAGLELVYVDMQLF